MCRGPNYMEVDIDVASSSVARHVVGLVAGAAKSVVVDMGILLQVLRCGAALHWRQHARGRPCLCKALAVTGLDLISLSMCRRPSRGAPCFCRSMRATMPMQVSSCPLPGSCTMQK